MVPKEAVLQTLLVEAEKHREQPTLNTHVSVDPDDLEFDHFPH
jgi:hypothetical protein